MTALSWVRIDSGPSCTGRGRGVPGLAGGWRAGSNVAAVTKSDRHHVYAVGARYPLMQVGDAPRSW